MLKLLLIAPTCDGQDVGEAWVAYQWVHRLAERHDVTLLTYCKRGKLPASQQLAGLRVIEWREPAVLGQAERLEQHAQARVRSLLLQSASVDPSSIGPRRAIRHCSPATPRRDALPISSSRVGDPLHHGADRRQSQHPAGVPQGDKHCSLVRWTPQPGPAAHAHRSPIAPNLPRSVLRYRYRPLRSRLP